MLREVDINKELIEDEFEREVRRLHLKRKNTLQFFAKCEKVSKVPVRKERLKKFLNLLVEAYHANSDMVDKDLVIFAEGK